MPTTTTLWPDADLAGAWELQSPLPVDGSAYTEPDVLGVDVVGYQGGDSNADGATPAALTLPEVDTIAATGDIDLLWATHWSSGATFSGPYAVPGNTITFTTPQDLDEDEVIEVEVFTLTTVGGAPSTPSCSGGSLTWNQRFHAPNVSDYKPRVTKWYAQIGAGGLSSGTVITVTWASSYRRMGQWRAWRGLDPSSPYDLTWSTAQLNWANSYPNAPAVTATTDGAVVYMTAGGDAASSGYTTPVVPAGYSEQVNSTKANSGFRDPVVMAMLSGVSPGSYDPAAMTGLNYSNEYAVIEVLRPAASSSVPCLVVVASSDETATTALSSGDVAISAGNEIQRLTSFLVGSGTRTLTFSGQTTGSVAYNASAATIQSALEALSNIDAGDVFVIGGPLDESPVLIEFQDTYAETDVPTITVSSSNTDPVNEIQALQSDRTGGTFTLTFGGQTTTTLPWNATRAQVEAALQALSTIGLNNVECTGGPLPTASILIEFTGALAGANQSLITVNDSGSGGTAGVEVVDITTGVAGAGMVIDTVRVGSAGADFTLVNDYNIPRGGAYEPQLHVFELLVDGYTPGVTIDVTVSSHDANHSWSATLLVLDQVDPAEIVEDEGSETGSTTGTTGMFGSITPSTSGAKVLAILAKARAGSQYTGTPTAGSSPTGYSLEAEALADAMTLGVWFGPPVAAAATSPGPIGWSGNEAWATVLLAIKPLVASSAGSDLYAVLDEVDVSSWIDLAPAAGSMFEVLEIDMDPVPADAVLTAARVELAHSCSVPNQIRIALVGINSDDSIVLANEQQVGYTPTATTTEVVTNWWTELSDGSSLNDFDRLGIALISSSRHPALSNHRVYWARISLQYEEGGPVTANVVGPASPGDPITWDYSSIGGYPQNYYEVQVIQGSSQDPDSATTAADALSASTGEIIYASGRVPGNLVRSLTLASAPLGRGACTVAVRAWSQITSSLLVASDWATSNFDITGSPATTPDQGSNDVAYDPDTGMVTVAVTAPGSVSRAWLSRSLDAGSTWALAEGGPYAVTASTDNDLVDAYTPGAESVLYQVSFDAGVMTETSAPDQIGGSAIDTTPEQWVFIVPADTPMSTAVNVAQVSSTVPYRVASANQPGGALVAISGRLGRSMQFTIRTFNQADRLALEAVLDSGYLLRVVNILGESWLMRLASDRTRDLQRWKALPSEVTALRDGYLHSFTLVEVAR